MEALLETLRRRIRIASRFLPLRIIIALSGATEQGVGPFASAAAEILPTARRPAARAVSVLWPIDPLTAIWRQGPSDADIRRIFAGTQIFRLPAMVASPRLEAASPFHQTIHQIFRLGWLFGLVLKAQQTALLSGQVSWLTISRID